MPKSTKKVEKSSSSSSDDSSAEEVKQTKPQQQKGKAAPAKKEDKKPAKKQESSDDSDSSSEDKPVAKKPATPAKKEESPAKKVEAKKPSKKEESSDSSSEDTPKKKKVVEKKKPGKKEESSDSDSDSDSEEEAKPAQNDKKRKANEDAGEEKPAAKKAKTEDGAVTTATEQNGDNNRLFLGNLSFKIDDDQIRAFFKDIGELTDIHWVTDKQTGKFYGTGFIAFATGAEAKAAVAKNGEDVLGRPIRIDFAQSKTERTPNKDGGDRQQRTPRDGGQREQRAPTPKPDGCTTVFLGNLSFQIDENAVRTHFGDCGEISSVRWVERDGQFKGCGFLEFSNSDATDKAVALNGSDILGRAVRVDYSAPKPPRQF